MNRKSRQCLVPALPSSLEFGPERGDKGLVVVSMKEAAEALYPEAYIEGIVTILCPANSTA